MVFGRTVGYPISDFISEIPKELKYDLNDDGGTQSKGSFDNINNKVNNKVNNNPHSFRSGFYNSKKPMASSEISGIECGVDKCAVKEELTIGVKVRHGKFGVGTVVSISSDNGETIVTIAFNNMGIKKLMLNKAGLELA